MKGPSFFNGKTNGNTRVPSPFKQREDVSDMSNKELKKASEKLANELTYTDYLFDKGNLSHEDWKNLETQKTDKYTAGQNLRTREETLEEQKKSDAMKPFSTDPKTGKYRKNEAGQYVNRDGEIVTDEVALSQMKTFDDAYDDKQISDEVAEAKTDASAEKTRLKTKALTEKERLEQKDLDKRIEKEDRAEFEGSEQSNKSKRIKAREDKLKRKMKKNQESMKGTKGLKKWGKKLKARRLANREDRVSDKRHESEAFDKLTPEEKKAYKRGTLKEKGKTTTQTGEASGKRTKADRRIAIQNAANMLAS